MIPLFIDIKRGTCAGAGPFAMSTVAFCTAFNRRIMMSQGCTGQVSHGPANAKTLEALS